MVTEDKRSVLESYNDLGGRIYDLRYKTEQEAKYRAMLDQIRPSDKDIVLDDGCGTGLLLQRLNSHSVGIDFSHRLLSTARSRVRDKPENYLVQADADHLPFRSSIFHRVFAFTLIQNIPELEQTLGEVRRVSRPDSLIAISALKKSFSINRFKQVLENSGLSIIKLILDEELKDWLAYATL